MIVAKMTLPRQSLNRAVAIYTGLEPVPDGLRLSGPFFKTDRESFHAVSIYSPDQETGNDALELVRHRYREFLDIPGVQVEIDQWHEYREMLDAWMN